MAHYEITDWTDYVRGVAASDLATRMDEHLAAGCPRCSATRDALRRVVALAEKERGLRLADGAVRSVKALGARRQPERPRESRCLGLELVYDSLREPAPAAVREAGEAPRRLVFRGEDLALDLVLARPEPGSPDLRLSGELVSSQAGPLPDVPALLIAGREVIDRSVTGPLGDFCVTCERPETSRLRILVGDGKYLDVPLGV